VVEGPVRSGTGIVDQDHACDGQPAEDIQRFEPLAARGRRRGAEYFWIGGRVVDGGCHLFAARFAAKRCGDCRTGGKGGQASLPRINADQRGWGWPKERVSDVFFAYRHSRWIKTPKEMALARVRQVDQVACSLHHDVRVAASSSPVVAGEW
jgi:hypothetical protein